MPDDGNEEGRKKKVGGLKTMPFILGELSLFRISCSITGFFFFFFTCFLLNSMSLVKVSKWLPAIFFLDVRRSWFSWFPCNPNPIQLFLTKRDYKWVVKSGVWMCFVCVQLGISEKNWHGFLLFCKILVLESQWILRQICNNWFPCKHDHLLDTGTSHASCEGLQHPHQLRRHLQLYALDRRSDRRFIRRPLLDDNRRFHHLSDGNHLHLWTLPSKLSFSFIGCLTSIV